jgi:hypothetical protein
VQSFLSTKNFSGSEKAAVKKLLTQYSNAVATGNMQVKKNALKGLRSYTINPEVVERIRAG